MEVDTMKKCLYNGQLYVKLSDNKFMFYPKTGIRQFAVFYDISGYNSENLKLTITTRRSSDTKSKLRITLNMDESLLKDVILEIALCTPLLMLDHVREDYAKFNKSLQIFGDYTMVKRGKALLAVFKHADSIQYEVFVCGQTCIYDVYRWLCNVWPMRCECTEYCIFNEGGIVEESRRFTDVDESFHVAEKCVICSEISDGLSLIVPWNKSLSVLLQSVAALLAKNKDEVRLLNRERATLRLPLIMDISIFRHSYKEPPMLWYDVSTKIVKCVSMRNTRDSLEVAILRDYSTWEMKEKLSKLFDKDPRILIISQNKRLLANEDIICPLTDVEYCIGESLTGITFQEKVGKGGFGEVFKCVVKPTAELRALKKFLIPLEDDSKRVALIREIVVVFKLPIHGNLVRYYDIYVDDIDIYIGMEYVSGGSLKNYIAKHGALNIDQIRKWSREMLAGLAHLHRHAVNHRDIKADNVLLCDSVAKLCDFGISSLLPHCKTKESAIQTKMFGTPRYMAPEVVCGERYAFMADIWSVGATIVEMVTGKEPHHGIEDAALVYHIGNERTIVYAAPGPMDESLRELLAECLRPAAMNRPTAECLLRFRLFETEALEPRKGALSVA